MSMASTRRVVTLFAMSVAAVACDDAAPELISAPAIPPVAVRADDLDSQLREYLASHGFTGRIASTLETRLGRHIDRQLSDLGRMLFFDPIGGLNDDNSCAGCHAPGNGFGDTQPIAIGIDNNLIVGPGRLGPRNQRRTPMVINTAFFPTLMWNSRFASTSGDAFDNSQGFVFPAPEGQSLSYLPHLLTAQAFIPPTERVEVAGFDFVGDNNDIRNEVLRRLNENANYRKLFGQSFPRVKAGGPITFDDFGHAIAEFEFSLIFADAPIDRYARGETNAMTASQKQGAVLFFGRGGCVSCHAVSGQSNEMFSDFQQHVAAIPQIAPLVSNMTFDGPGANEDFGLEQVTGNPAHRYSFRTSPLRNVALQPAFMHNGAFVRLEDAIRYHLNAIGEAPTYSSVLLPADLQGPRAPMQPVLDLLDARLSTAVPMTEAEFDWLIDFVRNGLLDPSARPQYLQRLIPEKLPSGRAGLTFQ